MRRQTLPFVRMWHRGLTSLGTLPAKRAVARRCAGLAGMLALVGGGCSPYPDDGEFLAGVVFANGFLGGVKSLDRLPAVGRGQGAGAFAPYTVIATSRTGEGARAVSTGTPASAPFWTNGGKRQPLARSAAQPVYVLDTGCTAPVAYRFDERLDLIRLDRQYPLFSDLPEVLATSGGRAGRTTETAYSAVVEVIHLTGSGAIPCQSIKRFATAKDRIGKDLTEVSREYRLLQIFDPAIAAPPLPTQLGFYNQLVVPYIDMGPVPLEPDGSAFRTMPLYRLTSASGGALPAVTLGRSAEAGPAYSPICRDYTLTLGMGAMPPTDFADPLLRAAVKTELLSSCVVCATLDASGALDCPFGDSQPGAQGPR